MENSPNGAEPKDARRQNSTFSQEEVEDGYEAPADLLRTRTRRDVLIFGAGTLAALAGGMSLFPDETLQRLGMP